MYKEAKFIPSGDQCLVMEFGNSIKPEINQKIRNMVVAIENTNIEAITEILPTYRSISIFYNPIVSKYNDLVEQLKGLEKNLDEIETGQPSIIELPTVYGGEYGPDIDFVAKHNNITPEEVIDIHTSVDYLIYMLGFTPGFSYLGGLDKRIETPRLKTPRTKIPAGSTGIAGEQTGIYPIDSPGGWQLIGRTPVKLYTPLQDPPVLLTAGDYVRFVAVSEEEYLEIENQIKNNTYKINIIKGGDIRG